MCLVLNYVKVLAAIFFLALPFTNAGECAVGWVKNLDNCYFIVSNQTSTFDEATAFCGRLGGALLAIESQSENDYLFSITAGFHYESFWIGYRQVVGSIWRWVDNTQSIWTNWDTEEPDADGSCTRMSTNSGEWRDRDCESSYRFACKRLQECGTIPTVFEATVSSNASTSLVGQTVRFTCNLGYEFPDESVTKISTCQLGGTWSPIPDCQDLLCPVYAPLDHVIFNTTDRRYSTVVQFECEPRHWFSRYEVNVTKTAVCLGTKSWSLNFTACEEIACIRPITSYATASTPWNIFGTVATYECDTGYDFPDNSTVKSFFCTQGGGWDPPPAPCEIRTCSEYNVTNAIPSTYSRSFNTRVSWECAGGHEYNDSSIVKYMHCDDQGFWQPSSLPDCYPISCGPIPNVTDAEPNTTDTVFGTVVNFTCLDGYFFTDGSNSRMTHCNIFGQWTVEPTRCLPFIIKIEYGKVYEKVEAPGSTTIGTAAMIFMITCLVLVVFLDVATIGKHLVVMRRNLGCISEQEYEKTVGSKKKQEIKKKWKKSKQKINTVTAFANINKKSSDFEDNGNPNRSRPSSAWSQDPEAGIISQVNKVDDPDVYNTSLYQFEQQHDATDKVDMDKDRDSLEMAMALYDAEADIGNTATVSVEDQQVTEEQEITDVMDTQL